MHYRVIYVGGEGVHRLEVWRDRDRRMKRVTDGELVSLATHDPGGAGYQMTILDRRRQIATKVDRTNLYRVGNFTDWFDLTHGLRHPKGSYTLTQISAPAGLPATPAPCSLVSPRRGPSRHVDLLGPPKSPATAHRYGRRPSDLARHANGAEAIACCDFRLGSTRIHNQQRQSRHRRRLTRPGQRGSKSTVAQAVRGDGVGRPRLDQAMEGFGRSRCSPVPRPPRVPRS